jgi:ABC-type glycerol-3-phosphate transport system substrate-binding protein
VRQLILICLSGLLILAACSSNGDNDAEEAPTNTPPPATPTSIAVVQPSPNPTGETDPIDAETLVLWWPDVLAPGDRPEVNDVLNAQINGFANAEDNGVQIDFRTKKYNNEPGSIMNTLASASEVAPNVLPDVTLIRRTDLIIAVNNNFIVPIDGLVNANVISDIYDPALDLGQVNDLLYGMPYMLEIQHMVYRPREEMAFMPSSTFEAMLAQDIAYVFPARRTSGVNSTVLAQYIDAGGTLPANGDPFVLNSDALLEVLTYYEQAVDQGIITSTVLEFANSADYSSRLALGEIDAAVVSSGIYLDEVYANRQLIPASIPTASGSPAGVLDGWMWVITAASAERQAIASRFINWMLETQRQSGFADVVHLLPSRPGALRSMEADFSASFFDALLVSALTLPPESFTSVNARPIQTAFISVISGEATAEEAVRTAEEQFASG